VNICFFSLHCFLSVTNDDGAARSNALTAMSARPLSLPLFISLRVSVVGLQQQLLWNELCDTAHGAPWLAVSQYLGVVCLSVHHQSDVIVL